MRAATLLVLILLLVPWVSRHAWTQQWPEKSACSSYETVVSVLWKKWHEKSISVGVTSSGRLLEVFVNRSTGSWSVVITQSSTRSCVVESGWNWRDPALVEEEET